MNERGGERASKNGSKLRHRTYSVKKKGGLGFLGFQIVSKGHLPSTAAITTRSIAVSVAVVILYSSGKAKTA